jgi:predicted RNA polymerase sigma factor
MRISDNPVVGLNHAVAVGMCQGPRAGLDLLETAGADERLAADHRVDAVRAHLLEMAGDPTAAHEAYERAAHRATNLAQRRYLHARAARLNPRP